MKRILVIGNIGSGKSTFSRKLGKKLNIPVIHLDKHFHQPNWTKPKPGEWDKTLEKLMKKEKWIMDGTYRRTLPVRFKQADTVIFLNTPKWLCIYRSIKRRFIYRKSTRSDLPDYLDEKITFNLMKKLIIFPKKSILETVVSSKKRLMIIESKETHRFINAVSRKLKAT